MILSDEQMACVTGAGVAAWEVLERPVGPQPLPTWVADAHVDWGNGHCGAPRVHLKVHGDVYRWDNQRWAKEGKSCYITRHPDGRAKVNYHDGPASTTTAWRLVDPTPPANRPAGERPMFRSVADIEAGITDPWEREVRECHAAWARWKVPGYDRTMTHAEKAEAEAREHLARLQGRGLFSANAVIETKPATETTQQDGFGGSHYFLTMLDGTTHVLRGPWHGGAPGGYVEVTTWNMDERRALGRWDRARPWFKRGGQAGLYLTEDLFIRIVSRFAAHAPLARVRHSYGWRIEPFRMEWGMPKAYVYEQERQRAAAKAPAGPHWKVFWDRSETYCGSPCPEVPTYGLEVAP